ncbi:MAG: hypothetical protein ACREQ9_24620, partial [Candidatus Binatia bacterium]
LHGAYLVVFRLWDALLTRRLGRRGLREWRSRAAVRAAGRVLTFNAVAFAFVLFRLDASDAMRVYARFLFV